MVTTTGLTAHPSRVSVGYPQVRGKCPACGNNCLFLAAGGYVTCAIIEYPDPSSASVLIESR